MDELIKQGQWWWLLIPFGTGIFALVGSWLGVKLGKNTEHSQWIRNEKTKAYTNFLSDLNPMSVGTVLILIRGNLAEKQAYDDARKRAYMALMLVANKPVMDHAVDLLNLTTSVSKIVDNLPDGIAAALEDGIPNRDEILKASVIEPLMRQVGAMDTLHRQLSREMRKDLGLKMIAPAKTLGSSM